MAIKQFSLPKRILFSTIIILTLAGLILAVGEMATRLFHRPSVHFGLAELYPRYGIRPKPNYAVVRPMKDIAGLPYEVHYRTGPHGFREYGDPDTEKFKVLFLGDSFTHSAEVSNEDTYYHYLGDTLPIEVFALGQAGYGNLQQLLVLEDHIDTIQPDLVVLQVCDNDFIDNHYVVEREAEYNVQLTRPYLTPNGEMVYRNPATDSYRLLRKSRFLWMLGQRFYQLNRKSNAPDSLKAEAMINRYAHAYKPYAESVQITREIFRRFNQITRDRSGFLVFSSHAPGPQVHDHKRICADLGIPFHFQLADDLVWASRNGAVLHASDGWHWAPAGQKFIAERLAPIIEPYLVDSSIATQLIGLQ